MLFLTRAEASQQVYVHSSLKFIVQEPSMAKNSSPSRAPKTGAQLRDDPEERENAQPYIATTKPSTMPPVSATGMSTSSGDELSLRHLQRETRRRCISTGTSITVDELRKQGHRPPCQHSNCGNSTVFCTVVTQAPVAVQQRASQPCPRTTPVGSRRSSAQFALWNTPPARDPFDDLHNRDIVHLVRAL